MIESAVVDATQEMAIRWLSDGRRVVQALLVAVEGSAPLPECAMLVVGDDGSIEGSITGGCVEGAVVVEAERILAGDRAGARRRSTATPPARGSRSSMVAEIIGVRSRRSAAPLRRTSGPIHTSERSL
jgi:xanthine/CO dehydrogenase XdhC/CoxF family maturation factor